MTDGPIFRLIYSSHSRIRDEDRTHQLGDIFAEARRHNREIGVTGALITTDDAFAQALEGDETAVRELFEHITADERHQDVTLLDASEVDSRVFGRWAMARVSEDGGPDIRLVSNASKRTIVAAGRDEHISAAQEQVLGFMRESLAHAAHS